MNPRFGFARRWAACLGAAGVLVACGGGGSAPTSENLQSAPLEAYAIAVSSAAISPSVIGLTKVSETRVNRTTFDYVFKVTVQNGSQTLSNVTATVVGTGPGTTVIDGNAALGDMGASASATSTDTITLRQDRTLIFELALLSWQVAGTPVAVPASLQLSPTQWVIGAGSPVAITSKVLDSSNQVIVPAPAVNFQLVPVVNSATGTAPTVAGGQINTSADTRGNYLVTGTVSGSSVSSQFTFTVIQNATQSKNSGLYVALGAALGSTEANLATINTALQANDTATVHSALLALTSAAATVDPSRMLFTTAYEPDQGFVPPVSTLAANGFIPVPGDAGYGSATTALRAKLQQITVLLNAPSANSATNDAQIALYLADLQAIAATLKTTGSTPGVYGVVDNASQVSDLLARDLPVVMQAIAARAAAELQAQGFSANRAHALAAKPGTATPSFFGIGGLLNALGPMGQLINKMYGDYLQQLQNMAIILGTKSLLDKFVTQNIQLMGIVSGAALLGPYAYNYFDSYIELSPSISVADARGADVYLIGGAAVNALGNLFGSIKPPSNPKSIKEIYDYFDSLIDAINGLGEAYDLAHQQPSSVTSESFADTLGCLASLSDSCVQLNYANGFKNVSGGNVSFTVLILVRTGGPRPQVGSIVVNFAPST
jgi:hypothetical protein